MISSRRLPEIKAKVQDVTARLQPFQHLLNQGLYTALSLHRLGQELGHLEADIGAVHIQLNNSQTQKLSKEVQQSIEIIFKQQ